MKLGIPDRIGFTDLRGTNLGRAWSGIVPSRCGPLEVKVRHSHSQARQRPLVHFFSNSLLSSRRKTHKLDLPALQAFHSRVAAAREARNRILPKETGDTKLDKPDSSLNLPIQIVAVVVVVAMVLCCICAMTAFWIWKSKKNQAYNEKQMLSVTVPDRGFVSAVQFDGRRTPELSQYSTSVWSKHPKAVEMSNPTVTPSAYSRSYEGSNVGLTAKELESSEERLQSLKRRMSTLKGPSGRFSSSMEHYEDTEWMNLNDILSNLQLGTELGGKVSSYRISLVCILLCR